MTPAPGKIRRRRLAGWVALALLLGMLGLIVYAAVDILAYSRVSELGRADAAIVLGAAAWGDQPSPVFRERINHAVELYKNGFIAKVIFTGGQGGRDEPAESVVATRYAVGLGVSDDDILIETRSHTTRENLYYAQQVAAGHGLDTFLIVSDPLHMRRAMRIAQDMGLEVHSSPTPTSRYQSPGSQARFLARETYFYIKYVIVRPFGRGSNN